MKKKLGSMSLKLTKNNVFLQFPLIMYKFYKNKLLN